MILLILVTVVVVAAILSCVDARTFPNGELDAEVAG